MTRTKRCLAVLAGLLAVSALVVWLGTRDPQWRARLKGTAANPFDRRESLDEQSVRFLFSLDRRESAFRYDPVALLLMQPNHTMTLGWAEAPSGRLVLRSNEQGFREDEPVAREKAGLRILVAGDSHTAGLVDNAESFCNVAERRLRAGEGREGLEVINAGVAYTGPYCYLRRLERYLELEPDVFVAVLFLGNDFWDDLRIKYWLDGWSFPDGDEEYLERLEAAHERWSGPVSQGMNQAYRWKHFPWEVDRALEKTIASYLEMQALCEAEGISLLAVILPTKMDVDGEDDRDVQVEVRRVLELEEADVASNLELGRRFRAAMDEAGIRCLDPTDAMRAEPEALYWRRDYHLGLAGHRFLGELLAAELESVLGARESGERR